VSAPAEVLAYRSGNINLVEALSVAKHLPAEALELASQRPAKIAGEVLAVVGRAGSGEALSEREQNLLFWGLHVLASVREPQLFQPLMRLLRRPADELDALLGDGVTATLPRVLASVFDGDPKALTHALVDPTIDESVRWSLFGAFAFLTFAGRIGRADSRAFLVRFDETRPVRGGDHAWLGWAKAIALLGLVDLADRVRVARDDARLLDEPDEPTWFEDGLSDAQARPDDPSRFAAQGLGYFSDVVEELDSMLADGEDEEAAPLEPARNPHKSVGRNDPCPCGSGKKFKKCCLSA
jgi:hypothetical protein